LAGRAPRLREGLCEDPRKKPQERGKLGQAQNPLITR